MSSGKNIGTSKMTFKIFPNIPYYGILHICYKGVSSRIQSLRSNVRTDNEERSNSETSAPCLSP